jgi:hypothetical protein
MNGLKNIVLKRKNNDLKKCTKCKEWKNIDDFHKDMNGKYGLKSKCKKCINSYYEEIKDEKKKKQKERYEKKKREILNKNKKYNQIHTDNIKEYRKKHYILNKENIKIKHIKQ